MTENTKGNIKSLIGIIQELYTIELIFADLKNNEVKINYNDEKFIIPYEYRREYLKNILNCVYDNQKYYNRICYMIAKEAEKTLKDNSQNIDRLLSYAVKLALGN
jgi:hypothetical protein